MTGQPAYWTDPLKLDFEARVLQATNLANGQVDLILEKTYFYPTGGGQPHDTGTIGGRQVLDVFFDESGNIIHRLDGDVTGPAVTARVDRERRLGHMQHHSAQHILSRALDQVLGQETLSVKISAGSPSTVDVPDIPVRWPDLARVEDAANQVVFEDRPIKTYFITEDEISAVPFRRPPQVTGQIRVVEIDSFDYSACGGTHCPSTGMIGLIKILKTERKNQKLRLHFVAGRQALLDFQKYHQVVSEICQQLNTSPEEVRELVSLQAGQLQAAQRELKTLRAELLAVEAERLAAQAQPLNGGRLVTRVYQTKTLDDLRELARLLQAQDDLVAVVAGYDGQKLSVVVSCANKTGVVARELLAKHLAQIGGRGGGDHRLAQGGGDAAAPQVDHFFTRTVDYVRELKR